MLEQPRVALGMLGARFHFRTWKDEIIPFAGAISEAHRVLLVLPLDGSPLFPVAPVITMLRARKREEDITVVVSPHSTEALDVLQRCPVVRLLPSEVSALFLPRKDALLRVVQYKCDVAIDLNLDFQLPSGYICRESKARFRIGFASKRADLFYNLQIQTAETESRTVRYERLAKCLEMF
jgi:ADP-heptose:LPS heptosyltransferase